MRGEISGNGVVLKKVFKMIFELFVIHCLSQSVLDLRLILLFFKHYLRTGILLLIIYVIFKGLLIKRISFRKRNIKNLSDTHMVSIVYDCNIKVKETNLSSN